MERPLQITYRDVSQSDALEADIRSRVGKLERFFPRITGCQVVVELPHKHKQQGNRFDVRLELSVPGDTIVVNREEREDVYVALRDVFDAARRRLEDHAQRLRGEVKAHPVPAHGRIARLYFDEGFGFIETASGDDYYFAAENVASPPFQQLVVGDEVQFLAEVADEGRQAKRVSVGKHHGP